MHWHSVPIDTHSHGGYFFIELIDDLVDLLLKGLQFLFVFRSEFLGFGTDEELHVFGVLEIECLDLAL